jgi:apolipoprotein N-acyltransferase
MKKLHLIGLSLLSAVLLSLAWPSNGFAPLIFIAFVPLFFVHDFIVNQETKTRKLSVFRMVYLSLFVWNVLTTWWIWNSTGIGAAAAIILNTLFMTTTFWLYQTTRKKLFGNKGGMYLLVFFWLSWEYLHLNWDLNWPWLNLGHVFVTRHTWIQWYEYTGVAGGTAWVLLMNILAFNATKAALKINESKRPFYIAISAFLALGIIPVMISKQMYSTYVETGKETEIVVVQPNVDPYNEQFELDPESVIERNLSLAATAMTPNTDFVLSPESAIQEQIWEERMQSSKALRQVQTFVKQYPHVSYVIGASTFGIVPKGHEMDHAARKFLSSDSYYYAYNTAFCIDSTNNYKHYHKSKLTPGVEMMPSWFFLRPLKSYAINLGGTFGTLKIDNEYRVFTNAHTGVSGAPLICYESVYGEFVTGFVRNGANIIFVITNDGWWGNTPGHKQHFDFSVLRAIETRRSVARSANTGISAFIDQRGDVYQKTPYWEKAVIRQKLRTNDRLTFYVKHGDYLSRAAVILSIIAVLAAAIRTFIRRKKSVVS